MHEAERLFRFFNVNVKPAMLYRRFPRNELFQLAEERRNQEALRENLMVKSMQGELLSLEKKIHEHLSVQLEDQKREILQLQENLLKKMEKIESLIERIEKKGKKRRKAENRSTREEMDDDLD